MEAETKEITSEQAQKIANFVNSQLPEICTISKEDVLECLNPKAYAQYVEENGLDGEGYRP